MRPLLALGIRVLLGHKFIPYGPFLSSSALVVLFTWRSIWTFQFHWSDRDTFSISKIFGDALGLAILLGIALAALVLLTSKPQSTDAGKSRRARFAMEEHEPLRPADRTHQ